MKLQQTTLIFVEPTCDLPDIVVTTSVRCISVCVCASVCLSKLVQAIACTFMHGFQNNVAQLFSLKSGSAI